ncbi:hypothetical protein LA080_012272 [Diaporthe eres]|nr:hypothetical protein LA080_012272 [Diaporthe eres]
MNGLDKVTVNGRVYGLIDFCINNADIALRDAIELRDKFRPEKNMAKNFVKLEKLRKESLDKRGHQTTNLIVTTPTSPTSPTPPSRRNRLSRALRGTPSNRIRQSQAVPARETEVSSQLMVTHEQPQVNVPSDLERRLTDSDAASRDPSDDQLWHAPEMSFEAPAPISPFPNIRFDFPPLTNQVHDIEITCEDGSVAFIAAKTTHADDNEGHETKKPLIPLSNVALSDAEELKDFLAKHPAPDVLPNLGAPSPTKSVNISSFFFFKFGSTDSEADADSAESDPSWWRYLCAEKFLLQEGISSITARVPCDESSFCDHTKIDQMDGGMYTNELHTSNAGHVLLATHIERHDLQKVRLFKGFDALVYERCTRPCGHTRLEGMDAQEDAEEDTLVHCMRPTHMVALIGPIPEILMTDEDTSEDGEVPGDEEYASDEEYATDEGDSEGQWYQIWHTWHGSVPLSALFVLPQGGREPERNGRGGGIKYTRLWQPLLWL